MKRNFEKKVWKKILAIVAETNSYWLLNIKRMHLYSRKYYYTILLQTWLPLTLDRIMLFSVTALHIYFKKELISKCRRNPTKVLQRFKFLVNCKQQALLCIRHDLSFSINFEIFRTATLPSTYRQLFVNLEEIIWRLNVNWAFLCLEFIGLF